MQDDNEIESEENEIELDENEIELEEIKENITEIKKTQEASSKPKPRLTTPQLYDLYRRLDINGDGELDMGEFLAVGKKLDFQDESLIVKAFRFADTSASGKLDMEEFVTAYEAMYNGNLAGSGGGDESYVRAVRYGMDKSSKPARIIMQSYTGSLAEITKFSDLIKESEKDIKGTLETIVEKMIIDSVNNQKYGSNILWWVDISTSDVLPNIVSNVIQNFGLPSDVEPCFLNEFLSTERDTRIRMGSGKITKPSIKKLNGGEALEVKSLNLFIQSMWLQNLPIVHEYGAWVDCLWPAPLHNIVTYAYSRLSQFFSYSGCIDLERFRSIQRSDRVAVVIYI
jgi:hypothetical protein